MSTVDSEANGKHSVSLNNQYYVLALDKGESIGGGRRDAWRHLLCSSGVTWKLRSIKYLRCPPQ